MPNYAQFLATPNLGMKEGLDSQTRAQRQGDFAHHNSIACVSRLRAKASLGGETIRRPMFLVFPSSR